MVVQCSRSRGESDVFLMQQGKMSEVGGGEGKLDSGKTMRHFSF